MRISIPDCELLQNIPYDHFWDIVKEHGTPIIENIDGKNSHCKVTFLYRSQGKINNVVLATYGLCSYDPRCDQLHHVENTDIYFRTYSFPRATRSLYCFSPNDPLISLAECDLYQCQLDQLTTNWEPDSNNSIQYFIPEWLVLGNTDKYFSILELPDAPHSHWLKKRENSDEGKITSHKINSNILNSERLIRVYQPQIECYKEYKYPLLIFYDGDSYLEYMSASVILDNLIDSKKIRPCIAVFISNPPPNATSRWIDLSCNLKFTNYITKELIPCLRTQFSISDNPADSTVIGASLGGLSAIFTAIKHPKYFGNAISQSGGFWWRPENDIEDGWLMKEIASNPKENLNLYLDVGSLETALTFGNGASILSSNRHMRDVLMAKGYKMHYYEYAGGHDYICWEQTLPDALIKIYG